MQPINFYDPEIQKCPYEQYKTLRDDHPVYQDPDTGIYHVSRYEDVRYVLSNHELFSGNVRGRAPSERQLKVNNRFQERGWVPGPTLISRDEPNHKQMRAMFNEAFRPARINQLDPFVESTARDLFAGIRKAGRCEWVRDFAVPLPLSIIVRQMGADTADLWRIKSWTDAFFKRISMMLSEDEEMATVDKEIEAQHYFQPIFERLRERPDDTLLSELVNREIPEWGRTLTDNELHAEMMADTFVGGSETTTNALSAGVKLLAEQPETWEQLKSDPDKYLRTFIEEVLRLESPVQCLLRMATEEVEISGVKLPAGAVIAVRYASANRDERRFDEPEQLDLDRIKPATHLAFGSGAHHCLGAPLARRELWWGFKVLTEEVETLNFAEDKNTFDVHPHFLLRSLKELHIEFTVKDKPDR
ncbi:MAG: cytochrome P450 [Pseudomonadales bacterium]|jgi:cytochrome P450|nr:cytochrome P450 [Pseudomonadales bacterium]MDC0894401.1 cytochrome P450 [Pseudomonadales bacterium]MDG1002865.1 cytochrome P450 [Pseudomonadales bacterium]MDG1305648.1 cytochrome P450 [Pseudomonadales bacterium]MDG1836940.1 cytochrome P450 [Pseudomonadales bacterium]